MGDLDGDFLEELVFWNWDHISNSAVLEIWGLNSAGKLAIQQTLPANPAVAKVARGFYSPGNVAVTLANVDRDSLVVKYKSNELAFSRPRVLAVLSAPPYHVGVDQNLHDSTTTFGRTQGGTVESKKSLGFSVGRSIGASTELSVFGLQFGVEAKISFEASMNAAAIESSTFQTSYSFTGGSDEDKVVFTAVPFDIYYYEVVSAEDPGRVGETVTISLPREPQTFSVSRTFYNANNGDAPDIDETVLSHTLGDPSSYPTTSERETLMNGRGWYNPTTITVGQGSGWQTLTISVDEQKGQSYETELSITSELEVTAAGVKVGASSGMSLGLGCTLSASRGLFVEGQIGDLPAESYTEKNLYRAGLFAYPTSVKAGGSAKADAGAKDEPLLVVNYWVE